MGPSQTSSPGEETDFGQSRFGHPDLAIVVLAKSNFGQSNCGQSNFGQSNPIWDLVCVMVGPRRVGPKPTFSGGPKNLRFFFFLSRPHLRFFFFSLSLSKGLLVEFWWCLKRRDPQMCTFGVLGLWCETPAATKPRAQMLRKPGLCHQNSNGCSNQL